LHGKNGNEMQEMMWQEHNVNFNDYPAAFKRGTFVRREVIEVELEPEELATIPIKYYPDGPVLRSRIIEMKMPKFNTVTNKVGVIFNEEYPRQEG